MRSTIRRLFSYWWHVWVVAVADTWAPLRLNLLTLLKWLLGAAIVLGGTYYLLGAEDYRKRGVLIGLTMVGSLAWFVLSLIWFIVEVPSRPELPSRGRSIPQLVVSLLVAVFLLTATCYFASFGLSSTVTSYANPSPTSTTTPTRSPTPSPTQTSTPTPIPPPFPTPTPTIDYRADSTCALDSPKPCYYIIEQDDSAQSISLKTLDSMSYAGRIADLIRDEDGLISRLIPGEVIVVPNPDFPRDIAFLQYFLGYPLCEVNIRNPEDPCLYVSQGEPYQLMAPKFYTGDQEAMIRRLKQANDVYFEQVTREVIPVPFFTRGDLVVIPSWP